MDRIEIRCTNAPAVDGRRRRRGERRRRRRRRRDASRRRRDVFSSIASFASSPPHARRVVTPHALQSSHHRIAVVSLARECTPRTCASTAPATPRESAPLDTFSANSFKPARAATGLVDLSFVRRARVVSLRPFVPRRALGGLSSSPANVRSRGRSDPSTASTTPCRRRARGRATGARRG